MCMQDQHCRDDIRQRWRRWLRLHGTRNVERSWSSRSRLPLVTMCNSIPSLYLYTFVVAPPATIC